MKELYYIANDSFFGIEVCDKEGNFVSGTDSKQLFNGELLFTDVKYVEKEEWETRKEKFKISQEEKVVEFSNLYLEKRSKLKNALANLGIDKELLEVL